MAVEPPEAGQAARRGHQPDHALGLAQGQAGGEETQGAAIVENGLRRNFMQAVQGEAATRQARVDRPDAKRQHAGIGMHMVEPGQQGTQFRQLLGSLAGEDRRRGNAYRHGYDPFRSD